MSSNPSDMLPLSEDWPLCQSLSQQQDFLTITYVETTADAKHVKQEEHHSIKPRTHNHDPYHFTKWISGHQGVS